MKSHLEISKTSYSSFIKRLILSAVLINLLLGIFVSVSLYNQRSQDEEEAVVTTKNICQILEQNISGIIKESDMGLLVVKDEYEQQLAKGGINESIVNTSIRNLNVHAPNVVAFRVADSNGTVMYGTGIVDGKPVHKIALGQEYLDFLRENPQAGLVVSRPVIGKVSKKWVIILARRLNNPDGSMSAVVIGSIPVEIFNKAFAAIKLGTGSVISLRNEKMELIARYPELGTPEKSLGKKQISKDLDKQLAEGRTEASYYTPTGSDNIARLVTFRKIGTLPFYIIVGISRDVYLADWWDSVVKSVFLLLFSIIASSIAVKMLCRTRKVEDAILEKLVFQEEKYRIVAENTLAWEFWLDPRGHFTYTSPSCEQLTGYSAEAFYSDPDLFSKIIHPDDKKIFITHRHEVMKGDGVQEYLEFRIVRPDGSILWIEHVCQPIFGKDGTFMGNRGCNRDITKRIHAEHELLESRQQLANIIDFLPDATFVIDNDKKVIAWNRAMEEMSGISKKQMLGQGDHAYTVPFYGVRRDQLLDLLDINDEELASKYQQVIRKGEILSAEVEAPFLYNGKGACLWASGAPLYSLANKRIGAIEIIRDISDKKKIEQDLLQAKLAAEASSHSKSEFLANMSHEIRTPMNAITGMAYLALQTKLDSQQRDYVSKIQQASESLLGIINDILDFSKIEAGKLELESIPFELGDLFEHIAAISSGMAEEKRLEVMFSLPVGFQQTLMGDPLRLGQVLGNLASNAVKFTERGHIVIAVEQAGPPENNMIPLTFSVQDTGIGMSREQLALVFEAFTQADSSITRKYGGTGLGLSIVTRLLKLMDATLEVESEPGKGSRFSFTIRIAVAREQLQKPTDIPEKLRGLRVLVVDDNAAAREILSTMITSFRFRVTAVGSGVAALAEICNGVVTADPYSLVLMDWMMPEMDGLETIRRIRDDNTLSQPPAIVMITAFGGDELRRQVLQLKKTAFLTKPVQPSSLLHTALELFGYGDRPPVRHSRVNISQMDDLKKIRGARVLVVEDNRINQQVAREIIEQAGILVSIADNGRKAVTIIESGEYFDAVLMDIQMLDMDGYEATRRIRLIKGAAELPIIAMTAHAMTEESDKCLAAGMNDHVAKPVEPQALYATLIRWIKPINIASPVNASTLPSAGKPEMYGDLPASLPGLDIAAGLMRAGDNSHLYCQILADFREQNRNLINELRTSLEQSESERVRFLIHTLKGLSATIGAMDLYATVSEYEQAIKEVTGDTCSALFTTLEQQLSVVFASIDILSATRLCNEVDNAMMPLPKDELEALMKNLYESLHNNSLGARKHVERLNGYIGVLEWKELHKHIARLDFEKAKSVLEQTGKMYGFDLVRGK